MRAHTCELKEKSERRQTEIINTFSHFKNILFSTFRLYKIVCNCLISEISVFKIFLYFLILP